MTGSRGGFLFSVLASSGFSLHVRAVREHGLVPGQAAPRSPLDSEKRSASHTRRIHAPPPPQDGLRAGLAVRPEGGQVAIPRPEASSPGSFLRIWWKTAAKRTHPQGGTQSLWLVGHAKCPTYLVLDPTLQVGRPSTCGYSCDAVG